MVLDYNNFSRISDESNYQVLLVMRILSISVLSIFIFYCETQGQNTWEKKLPGVGTFSSPRVADLNDDGVGDIILGAGRVEFQSCDSAVIALDGKTGDLLWNVSAKDQIFGSASLLDITNDGIVDVFISGRSAELIAINGKTGNVIWRFKAPNSSINTWFNFYNSQFIPDQNNDGVQDILVSNGGDVLAEPYDPNRPAGQLVIFDSTNGEIISRAIMPDGKETYMSVAVLPGQTSDFKNVIYGTGGETLGGNLFLTSIAEIMAGDLSKSIKLDSSKTKGFIAPAAWVDLNNDGIHDIVANAVDGRLIAIDGKTHQSIWTAFMKDTEAYSSLAIGRFNSDSIPDLFVSYAQGVWPKLNYTKQYLVDGKTGNIQFMDSLGFYQTSTPVVAELTGDNLDEVLLSVNYQSFDSLQLKYLHNMLVVIDFKTMEVIELDLKNDGYNISSTPWIGDLDENGYLDLVYCHSTNAKQSFTYDGMQVNRIDSQVSIKRKIKWGAYMGSAYNGVYDK